MCASCQRHVAARTAWRRYVADGGCEDIRTWAAANLRLPEAFQWQQLRAECKRMYGIW